MSWSRERIEELEDALANSECLQYHYENGNIHLYVECPFCGCCASTKEILDTYHAPMCRLVELGIKNVSDAYKKEQINDL